MKLKVIVIPHAGGLASAYYPFKKYNSDLFEYHFIELSGRGKRIEESLYENFIEATEDILLQISNVIFEGPYVIFGHSMGSWLSYELYYQILERGFPLPLHMFLSGNRSPFIKPSGTLLDADDEHFIDYIVRNHNANRKIFRIEKLRELFLPILRADYRMMELYRPKLNRTKISVDISVLGGDEDPLIISGFLDWQRLANANIYFKKYSGKHFYIFDKFEEVSNDMRHTIELKHQV